MVERTKRLSLLLSEDERRMLQEIAEAQGLTTSDVIRQFIRAEWAGRFAEELPAKPRRRKR